MKEQIKTIRQELGMTQSEFGEATGKNRDIISNYEQGRVIPDPSFLMLLEAKFGYSAEWIKTGAGAKRAQKNTGIEAGMIAAEAVKRDPAEARAFFRYFADETTDAEILMMYELFKRLRQKRPE